MSLPTFFADFITEKVGEKGITNMIEEYYRGILIREFNDEFCKITGMKVNDKIWKANNFYIDEYNIILINHLFNREKYRFILEDRYLNRKFREMISIISICDFKDKNLLDTNDFLRSLKTINSDIKLPILFED